MIYTFVSCWFCARNCRSNANCWWCWVFWFPSVPPLSTTTGINARVCLFRCWAGIAALLQSLSGGESDVRVDEFDAEAVGDQAGPTKIEFCPLPLTQLEFCRACCDWMLLFAFGGGGVEAFAVATSLGGGSTCSRICMLLWEGKSRSLVTMSDFN